MAAKQSLLHASGQAGVLGVTDRRERAPRREVPMTTEANTTQITQADLDAYFAADRTGYPYPPSDDERFAAWLRLNGYEGLDVAVLSSDLSAYATRFAALVAAAAQYAEWLQENPYCTQAGRAAHNR